MRRMRGIVVEAELGQLGGVEEHVAVDEANAKLTDPNQAKDFVTAPGATRWRAPSAPATVRSSSAARRACVSTCSPRSSSGCPVSRWSCTAPSVPQEEVARINAAGGKLGGAKGVDDKQFKRAAELGVTKINIDTDGRLVWTRVHREYFRDFPEKFDLRDPGKVFQAEYARFIASKNEKLGSAGQSRPFARRWRNKDRRAV